MAPREIIKGEDGGILFENNNINDLRDKIIKFFKFWKSKSKRE